MHKKLSKIQGLSEQALFDLVKYRGAHLSRIIPALPIGPCALSLKEGMSELGQTVVHETYLWLSKGPQAQKINGIRMFSGRILDLSWESCLPLCNALHRHFCDQGTPSEDTRNVLTSVWETKAEEEVT
jgi:hypothetical protein